MTSRRRLSLSLLVPCLLVLGLTGSLGAAPAPSSTPAAKPPAAQAVKPAAPAASPQAQAAAAAQAQAEAQAQAARVQARYRQITSLSADYLRKSLFVAAGNDSERTVEGSGFLLWARPTSLRLEQEEPRKELIVTQQGSVWWVRPQRSRADIYPLDRFTTGLRSLMDALGGLARVDEAFTVEPPAEGDAPPEPEGLFTLVLKPKEKRADLQRLVLWFSNEDTVLHGFRIISLIGDITEYRFQQVRVNPGQTAESFNYQAPADYKVTDHRAQPLAGQPN